LPMPGLPLSAPRRMPCATILLPSNHNPPSRSVRRSPRQGRLLPGPLPRPRQLRPCRVARFTSHRCGFRAFFIALRIPA
jgi:hypothetical protein